MGFPVAAAIAGGTSLISGIFGKNAANKAADAQVRSGEQAIAEMRRQYDLSRKDFAPYREAGGEAIKGGLAMLQPGYDHTTGPGYQFRVSEGMRAIDNGAAAKGMLMSGGTLKDYARFNQGMAASDFQDSFNRNMAVAAGGQQATTSLASLGGANSANIGNTMMGMGNARASGYMGGANAMSQGLGGLAQIGMMEAMGMFK